MLAAAMAVGGLGLTAAPAKAAQIGIYIGSGAEYVPPCPGPGYTWIAGYYSNGYWNAGRWIFNSAVRDRDIHYRNNVRGRDAFRGNNFDRDHRADRRDNSNRGRDNDRRDNRGHGR
jgi:hypothetical protein